MARSTTRSSGIFASASAARHSAFRAAAYSSRVEKPAARSADELAPVVEESRRAFRDKGVVVKVGFNHRFHPATAKAIALARGGTYGPILHVRARYGHGGRLGYESEWRARRAVSGGPSSGFIA